MYTIYAHILKLDGRAYIGQTTKELECRSGKDGIGYHLSPKFYEAIQKYGWDNFEHIILETCETEEEADLLEQKYIQEYNSIENGFNILIGGHSLYGQGNPMYGKKHTEETKEKIRQSRLGKPNTEAQKEAIRQSTLGGKNHSAKSVRCIETGIIYGSATDAAVAIGKPRENGGRSIARAARGERSIAYGYHWERVLEDV